MGAGHMSWNLNTNVVLRPESKGALLFNPENAETVYVDREGLFFLKELAGGKITASSFPISEFLYFRKKRIIVEGEQPSVNSKEKIESCIGKKLKEIPNSLSVPETIHIALTDDCDQSCGGCFYSKAKSSMPKYISLKLFRKIVHHAYEARVFQFAFGGGEPLLHPQILNFVTEARRMNIVPNITTNGNLLTPELASGFKQAGLGQIQISLNGSIEEINAVTRPNYQKAVEAINICREAGLRFGVNSLVTKKNYQELPSLFVFAQKMGALGVNLLRPKPPVDSQNWLEESSLSLNEQRELHKILRTKNRDTKIPITLDQSLCFLAWHRHPQELLFNGVWGCGAGRRFLTIDPEGNIFPCSHYRVPIGSSGDFMKAWNHSSLLEDFRLLEKKLKGNCLDCRFVSVCRGCRAVVEELGGNFYDEDPHCPGSGLTS
jgi:pyrroloquinoline quinone biosynthesis protein E